MKLEEHQVGSSSGTWSRRVRLLKAPAGSPRGIAVFLDGEYYVEKMAAPELVLGLQRSGEIPPRTCVFVSHVDAASRHRDFPCNESYAEFIATDLMRWIRERSPELPEGGHFIGGTSLAGLAASFITLSYPQVFSRCLSQSGSFWWKDEWLTGRVAQMPGQRAKFWVSVGDREVQSGISHPPSGMRQEVAQLPACERFAEALKQQGHEVAFRLHPGVHEINPWRDELPDALRWLG